MGESDLTPPLTPPHKGEVGILAQPQISSATSPTPPTSSRHQANSAKPWRETKSSR